MVLYDLCEHHLANSDHTSPSSVRNIGAYQLVGELGKTASVGDPDGIFEDLIN